MRPPRPTSRPWVAKRSGPHTRPHIHLKTQAPPLTQSAWGSEIRKTLPPRYEPWEHCLPSTPAALPLKLIKCNFTYIMGYYAFSRMTAIVNHFLPLMASLQIVFCKSRTLSNLTVQGFNLMKPTSSSTYNVVYGHIIGGIFSHSS